MCLIFLSFNQHQKYPFIALANRDEFYDRPAKPIHHWQGQEEIIGGKDIEGGGTWLGITTTGQFAMLTNYRDMANIKAKAPTRGKLVSNFLIARADPATYLQALNATRATYNGFNIILGSFDDPWYYSNQNNRIYRLGSGIYGLSNALLDTPWPKLIEGKADFTAVLAKKDFKDDDLFELMTNRKMAEDHQLPETGIGYEKEKQLSSRFILMRGYGTRNTTLVKVDRDGNGSISEKVFDRTGSQISEKEIYFRKNN